MTRDKKPKPPTSAELRILQEARSKHAAEFKAIRERICPSSSPFGQETALLVKPEPGPALNLKADDHSNDDLNLPHTY